MLLQILSLQDDVFLWLLSVEEGFICLVGLPTMNLAVSQKCQLVEYPHLPQQWNFVGRQLWEACRCSRVCDGVGNHYVQHAVALRNSNQQSKDIHRSRL